MALVERATTIDILMRLVERWKGFCRNPTWHAYNEEAAMLAQQLLDRGVDEFDINRLKALVLEEHAAEREYRDAAARSVKLMLDLSARYRIRG